MAKAKDPAVLWYYRDYLSGTEEMSWAEQGAYARLLNKQADKGHLPLEAIKKILKKDFAILWPGISSKFLTDPNGNFYNDRMDIEVAKRSKNSQAQRDRIQKWWDEQRNNRGDTTEHSTEYTTVIPIANANASKNNNGAPPKFQPTGLIPEMVADFTEVFPGYPTDYELDFPSCMAIAQKICAARGWNDQAVVDERRFEISRFWREVLEFVKADDWYSTQSISMICKKWQDLMQARNSRKPSQSTKSETSVADQIKAARAKQSS